MDKQRQLHPEDDMNSIELTNVSHHSDHCYSKLQLLDWLNQHEMSVRNWHTSN